MTENYLLSLDETEYITVVSCLGIALGTLQERLREEDTTEGDDKAQKLLSNIRDTLSVVGTQGGVNWQQNVREAVEKACAENRAEGL